MSESTETVEIPLTRGMVAIVDAEDAVGLLGYSWQAAPGRSERTFHARRAETVGGGSQQRQRYIYMHRQILNAPKGVIVDHIDRDGLNNRKANLRFCSVEQNTWNRPKRLSNTSGYIGVYRNKDCLGWIACQRGKYLGMYPSPEEAARAYDTAARRAFGEFANLNFPDDFRPVEPSLSEIRPNNTSGYTGVIRVVVKGKIRWLAKIFKGGKSIHVGTFNSPEEAAAAREARLASIAAESGMAS